MRIVNYLSDLLIGVYYGSEMNPGDPTNTENTESTKDSETSVDSGLSENITEQAVGVSTPVYVPLADNFNENVHYNQTEVDLEEFNRHIIDEEEQEDRTKNPSFFAG